LVCGNVIDRLSGKLRCVDHDVTRERSLEERRDAEIEIGLEPVIAEYPEVPLVVR